MDWLSVVELLQKVSELFSGVLVGFHVLADALLKPLTQVWPGPLLFQLFKFGEFFL